MADFRSIHMVYLAVRSKEANEYNGRLQVYPHGAPRPPTVMKNKDTTMCVRTETNRTAGGRNPTKQVKVWLFKVNDISMFNAGWLGTNPPINHQQAVC